MKLIFFKRNKINNICKKADKLLCTGSWKEAIELYHFALSILPKPIESNDAYNWLYVVIGDVYYVNSDLNNALLHLTKAYENEEKNGFMFLRLGQVYFDLGEKEKAKEFLKVAFLTEGREIFYDQDNKYLELAILDYVSKEKSKWFSLSKENQHIEDDYFKLDKLYLQNNWEEIYSSKVELYNNLPEELNQNSIVWFLVKDILEACIFLRKIEELDTWYTKLLVASESRMSNGENQVWEALIQIKKRNDKKGEELLNQVVKLCSIKRIKNFYHFNNQVYKYYKKQIDEI